MQHTYEEEKQHEERFEPHSIKGRLRSSLTSKFVSGKLEEQ
jgi:hypothetical protein